MMIAIGPVSEILLSDNSNTYGFGIYQGNYPVWSIAPRHLIITGGWRSWGTASFLDPYYSEKKTYPTLKKKSRGPYGVKEWPSSWACGRFSGWLIVLSSQERMAERGLQYHLLKSYLEDSQLCQVMDWPGLSAWTELLATRTESQRNEMEGLAGHETLSDRVILPSYSFQPRSILQTGISKKYRDAVHSW